MQANNAYFLLGSNLGNRVEMLQKAAQLLQAKLGSITSKSVIYETAPWGIIDQPAFLNQVIVIPTHKRPIALLRYIHETEEALGRVRHEKWGSRLIDVDLLYYGDIVLKMPELIVPHPFIQERRFTLVPLVEIAPNLVHPSLQLTQSQLLENCIDHSEVVRFEE